LLLNRTAAVAAIPVHWSDLGLLDSSAVTVRDVWAGKELGTGPGEVTLQVAAGDAVLLLIRGTEAKWTTYKPVGVIKLDGSMDVVPLIKGHVLDFADVASRAPVARIQIVYRNPETVVRFAELRVNGRIATRIAFPPTGRDNALGMVTIESLLDRAGAKNVLSFSASSETGLGIESISLE
jgi:alpha-galactosidase